MPAGDLADCGFTYGHYRSALQFAQSASYRFLSFPDALVAPPAEKYLLLRHDVDHSIESAEALAEIESDLGIRATYFVLPHGAYNVLGAAGEAVRRILDAGHWLGIHYDPSLYLRQGLPFPQSLHREASLLEDRFGVPVSVAARHNPVTDPAFQADLSPLLDAYAPEFAADIRYLSDSCQFWREGCFCQALQRGERALQVLVHGEWWTADGARADVALDRVREERMAAVAEADRETRRLFASLEHLPHRDLFAERP